MSGYFESPGWNLAEVSDNAMSVNHDAFWLSVLEGLLRPSPHKPSIREFTNETHLKHLTRQRVGGSTHRTRVGIGKGRDVAVNYPSVGHVSSAEMTHMNASFRKV